MNKGFELRHLHRRVRDGPLTGGLGTDLSPAG
jgi:hypothetical protein